MELQINNQKKIYPVQKLNIQELLDIEKPNNQKGIAIAVNRLVIPRSLWTSHYVESGNSILIITATQGG